MFVEVGTVDAWSEAASIKARRANPEILIKFAGL
jgi:hypothetical protein